MDNTETITIVENSGGVPEKVDPPKRLSGAARRKLKKFKKEQEQLQQLQQLQQQQQQQQQQPPINPQVQTQPFAGQSTEHEEAGPATNPEQIQTMPVAGQTEQQETGGYKRIHSEDDSVANAQLNKKSRVQEPACSYRTVMSNIRMAVVPEGFPVNMLDGRQASLIRESLLQVLDNMDIGGPAPRFSEAKYRRGALFICCMDQSTQDWLVQEVARCKPWNDAKLRVIHAKDVENLLRPPQVRVMTWIPGTPQVEPEKVLKRLTIQNPGVITEPWRVINRQLDPKGQQLMIMMGQNSWQKIQEMGCYLYFSFNKVMFKALGRRNNREGDKKMGMCPQQAPPHVPPPIASSAPPTLEDF